MRFYRIVINGKMMWSSLLPSGTVDPGALNIEFDIPIAPQATPYGSAWLRVWGIPLSMIAQSTNYSGQTIQLFGGMSAGLPLANPAQQGILAQGLIQQCWGNWMGTNMTLDFLLMGGWNAPGTAATATTAGQSKTPGGTASITPQTPLNLILNWLPGTTLATAIQSTLSTALPGWKSTVNIAPSITNSKSVPIPGFFQNLTQFATFLQQRSIDAIAANPYGGVSNYRGVQLVVNGSTVNVFDGTTQTGTTKQIALNDLIGQPTWQSAKQVQVTCVLRGDLSLGQIITLPGPTQTQVSIKSGQGFAPSASRDNSIFQGTFEITAIRHIGNYKQHIGEAWVTVIDCVAQAAALPASTALPNVSTAI